MIDHLRVAFWFALVAGHVWGISPQRAAAAELPQDHPPIGVKFTLPEAGLVTLVIEDEQGKRVRNLVSETPFPAGANVVWWDGLDDLGRDTDAAAHAIYHIPGRLVAPGKYTVRGLSRKAIDLKYEFTVYNPGTPPWPTADASSQWLTNHTPPASVCFIPAGAAPARRGEKGPSPPQVLIGSYVAEGGSGLAWVDLEGRKLHGQMWLGGVWTGAAFLTRDGGDKPEEGVYAYAGSAWPGDKYSNNQAELRLHALVNGAKKADAPRDKRFGFGEDPAILTPTYKFPAKEQAELGGLAARNGLLLASLTKMNQVLFIDAAKHKVLGTADIEAPRAIAFEKDGKVLVLSDKQLLRTSVVEGTRLAKPQPLVDDLEDPVGITLDDAGNIYIADRGKSHQVRVFAADGKPLRRIGTAGVPKAGRYDPTHMNNPHGVTISGDGHLWVAEDDFQPKRVSVWTLDGKLLKAFHGPPIYGGGGVLDPRDKSLFYLQGMTFKLDWQTGTSQLTCVHYRPGPDDLVLPRGHDACGPPETAFYFRGRKYLTNCYGNHPTNGSPTAVLWIDRDGLAVPAAAAGQAKSWKVLESVPGIADRLPPTGNLAKDSIFFTWSDLNGDQKVQAEEVSFVKAESGGITVTPDLSFVAAWVGSDVMRYAPQRFTADGVPVYRATGEALLAGSQRPTSSGGGQAIACEDGRVVVTVGPMPFARESMGGGKNGSADWSYPSVWPGLHASHISAPPELPGELIGTTRLLGPTITPRNSDAGEIWAVNGNKGNVYLLTADGLFVATLLADCRDSKAAWANVKAERGTILNNVTNMEESFWPSITQTADGNVYLVTNWPSLIRIEGLESIRRIPPSTLELTPEALASAQAYFQQSELRRQAEKKSQENLIVAIRKTPPVVDGKLDDWADAKWVTIDIRSKQKGDWGRTKQESQAAVAIAGDRLYAAFKTGEPKMLANSGLAMQNLFKTGGALDLMIGTDGKADPKRKAAAAGDLRLLVSQVKGKTVAVLYRPVAPGGDGAAGEPVSFSSPLRTIKFDRVEDVSSQVTLVGNAEGDFEMSVPLAVLGLRPAAGGEIRGDVGLLRGNGFETVQRVYWSNKATGLTSDIPSEAELTPRFWGVWRFAGSANEPR